MIQSPLGIHARPASSIAQMLQEFECEVTFACNGRSANAKSVIEILMLAASHQQELVIEAHGADAAAVVERLVDYLERGEADGA